MTDEEKKVLTKTLFNKYTTSDNAVDEAKKKYEEELIKRSKIVEEIHTSLGKGPFPYQGHSVKIVIRGETHFFRGKSKEEALKVD